MKRAIILMGMVCFLYVFLAMGGSSYAQGDKPIELRFSHWMSPMHNLHVGVFAPFAKDLEERTKGRVKMTIYPGEALGKAKDHYDMIAQGMTDMGMFIQGYTAGRFPLTSVIELPIQVPSGKVGSRVIWELYGRYLKQEYPGVKLLTLWTHDPGHLHMAKKPVRKLDDLKGVRLRSPGPVQMQVIKELGGSPLTLPVPELYDSLQRGMVDGTVIGFSAVKDFKLYEVLKYHTFANLYVMPMGMAINPKTWDSLPPDVQKIIEDLTGGRMAGTAGASFDQYDLIGQDFAKKAGAEFITLSPDEQKKWIDRIKPLNDKWVADMEGKGLPGKKIFEEASQLVKKYSK